MDTIVFASHKGGCGKSILAACLAVAAQAAGERVFVLDLDPKKSLVRWSAKRKDRNLPVRAVSSAKLPAALSVLVKRQVSLVILDTPSFESPASLAAMEFADLSIVPVRPGTFDIWASEVTGRKLKLLDKEFVFVLNQCSPVPQALHVQEYDRCARSRRHPLAPPHPFACRLFGGRENGPRRDRGRSQRRSGAGNAFALAGRQAPAAAEWRPAIRKQRTCFSLEVRGDHFAIPLSLDLGFSTIALARHQSL